MIVATTMTSAALSVDISMASLSSTSSASSSSSSSQVAPQNSERSSRRRRRSSSSSTGSQSVEPENESKLPQGWLVGSLFSCFL